MKIGLMASILAAMLLVAGIAFAADSIMVKEDAKFGSYITDDKGMALYSFRKDTAGKSVCAGDCAAKWPAFYAEKLALPKGLDAKDFGSIKREDGKMQTTFRGMPLYYFGGDKKDGDLNGQGKIDSWFVIDPAKFMK